MVKKIQGANVNKLFPQSRKNGPEFRMDYKLTISSLTKAWGKFQYIRYPDVAILRGSLCQTSKRFRARTNGRQDAANCIVAIIFANIFTMSVWIPKFIDKILIIGDELLTLSITFKPRLRYEIARPKDLYNNVYIDDVKITYTTDGPTVSGKLYPENGHTDLETTLKEYLETNGSALCAVMTLVVAFWKKGKGYYYFDPHERDENGKAVRFVDGKACVMRFLDLEQMVNAYCQNLDRSKNFTFTLFPINILRMAKVRVDPPEIPKRKVPISAPRDIFKKPKKRDSEASSSTSIDKKAVPPLEPDNKIKDVYEMNPEYVKVEEKYRDRYKHLENIPETHVTALSIEIKPHVAPSVTYFQPTSSNTGILRGNTYKRSDLAPSISLYCLGMLKIYKSRFWTKDIVNHILYYGHKLYKQSFYKQGSGGDRRVELKDVFKDIMIMGKRFTPYIDHSTVIGVLNTVQEDQVDLQRGIEDFFREYDTGIIQGPITVAIWQEADLYYMFDPCERDNNGCILQSKDSCEELPEGKACVTWFKLLDDLTKLYCDNIPKEKRFDPFFISNVVITDYVEVPLPWCNFIGIKPGKWILRGTFNQNSSRFADDNRNSQCTAIAAIAITFRLLYIMEDWSSDIIDNILLEGDEFYSSTVQHLKDTNKFSHPFLMLDELLRSYTLLSISGKHNGKRINFDVRECLVNGVISARDDNDQIMNLKKGIVKFFTCYECGIVTAGNISVAIWKYNNYYYYFDSHSRDHKGVVHGIGTACVLRLESIDELVKSIETNLQPASKDFFNIGYCEASIWETDESGLVKPPLNNYTRINDTSAILRATHHEGDKLIYYENANRQTFSNCIVASAMMKIVSPSLWTVMIMDEILKYGNLLHERAYLKVLDTDPNFDENLTFNECEKAFRLGDYFVTVESGDPITSNFEVESQNVLLDMFTSHFRQDNTPNSDINKCAIFSSPTTTIACWTDLDVMYIFDPKEMDNQGISYDKDIWSDRQITPAESFMEYEGEGKMLDEQTVPEMMDEDEERPFYTEEESEYSNYTNTERPPGKAYVRWFTALDTFVQHIIDNTPPNQLKTAEFLLQPLKVTVKVIAKEKPVPPEGTSIQPPPDADPAYIGPWYKFQEINYGMWIVRGSHCYSDLRYAEINRGNQDAAIAIAFFVLKHSIEIREFQSGLIDAVLKYGDKLHTYCLQKLKKSMMMENLDPENITLVLSNTRFEPYQIFNEFCLGQHIYKLKLDEKIISGDITSTGEANPITADDEPVKNLYDALEFITYKEYKNCIIHVKNKSFAIYKGQKMYYLFDPNCRGPNGLKTTNGVACLLRCMFLDQLVEIIKLNLPEEGSNRFYIDGVNIEKIPIKRGTQLGKKKLPTSLTEPSAYRTIQPGKIILTGTLSQEDKRFNRGKHVQSAACALVALAMSEIHRTDTWTKDIVDEIIINGDRLYGATVDNLGFKFNPWEETMTVQICDKDFYVGVNHVICEMIDELDEHIMPLAKLHYGVERFFNSNLPHGIIQSNRLTAAIWKDSKFYYIFYPYPLSSTGQNYQNGAACIMGFNSTDVLSEHCLTNIPRESYQETFTIVPIAIHLINKKSLLNKEFYLTPSLDKQVIDNNGTKSSKKRENKIKKSKKLSKYWVSLKEDSSILYGGFSQTSKVFIESSRGYQAAANAIIAIVMFHLNEPSSWTQNTLNSILMSGDQLYKDSYLRYRPLNREIGLNMLLRKFYIEKYCVEVIVYKATIVGKLNEIDISTGIHNFFLHERAGVFIAYSMTLAIFQKGGQYYLFDPYGCELKGDVDNHGRAILIRYKNLANIANYLYAQFSTNDSNEKQYNIHAIQIKDIVYVP